MTKVNYADPRNWHPVAAAFPRMTEEEFEALKKDIETNGQVEPAAVYNGLLLDGINRAMACGELGVELQTKQYSAKRPSGAFLSPEDWVISENVIRRHLTPSQRAAYALELEPVFSAEAAVRQSEGRKKGARRDAPRTEAGTFAASLGPNLDPSWKVSNSPGKAKTEAAVKMGVAKTLVFSLSSALKDQTDEVRKAAIADVKRGGKGKKVGDIVKRFGSPPKHKKKAPLLPAIDKNNAYRNLTIQEVVLRFFDLLSYESAAKAWRSQAAEFHPDRSSGNLEKATNLNSLWQVIERKHYKKGTSQ